MSSSRPRVLRVTVVEARGLRSRDSILSISKTDPYAKVWIKPGQELKTSVKKNAGSTPRWDETFEFVIHPENSQLFVSVYDHDTITKDDRLGSAVIALHSAFNARQVDDWYTLHKRQAKLGGEIHLVMVAEGEVIPPDQLATGGLGPGAKQGDFPAPEDPKHPHLEKVAAFLHNQRHRLHGGRVEQYAEPPIASDNASDGIPPWKPGQLYAEGDRVEHEGSIYVCEIGHLSQEGWMPGCASSMWTKEGATDS